MAFREQSDQRKFYRFRFTADDAFYSRLQFRDLRRRIKIQRQALTVYFCVTYDPVSHLLAAESVASSLFYPIRNPSGIKKLHCLESPFESLLQPAHSQRKKPAK